MNAREDFRPLTTCPLPNYNPVSAAIADLRDRCIIPKILKMRCRILRRGHALATTAS